jgi:Domain of unknown function (DUF4900)
MLTHQRSQGIAIVIVLLSAVIFLGIVVAITGTLSLSSRKTTADQRVTLTAQYASESGLSRVMAEAQSSTGLLAKWSTLIATVKVPLTTTTTTLATLAKRFCNQADTDLPNGTGVNYCAAPENTNPDVSVVNVSSRYSVFVQFLSRGSADPLGGTSDYAGAGFTNSLTNDTDELNFWNDAFSGGNQTGTWGPSQYRFNGTLDTGVNYRVSFGLVPSRVEIIGGVYSFVFKPRTATAAGQYANTTSTQLSSRQIVRTFQDEYRINMTPPSFAYYALLTNSQTTNVPGVTTPQPVYLNNTALFDGPVHTNGRFNFSGNPWFSSALTSAGCTGGTTTTATSINCNGVAVPGANTLDAGSTTPTSLDMGPTDTSPNFNRWLTPTTTNTGPELAKDNASPNAAPAKPWNYVGKWNSPPIRLPVSANENARVETEAGLVPDPENPSGPQVQGIVFKTNGSSTTPGDITNLERVELVATSSAWNTAWANTSYATVANGGTGAQFQVIRLQYQRNIERCYARPTSISVNPSTKTLNPTNSFNITATVNPTNDTYFDYRAEPLADWSTTDPYSPARGLLRNSSSDNSLTTPRLGVNYRADVVTTTLGVVKVKAATRFAPVIAANGEANTAITIVAPVTGGGNPPPLPTDMSLSSINVPGNAVRLENAAPFTANLSANVSGSANPINVSYAITGPTLVSTVPAGATPSSPLPVRRVPSATTAPDTASASGRTGSFQIIIGALPAGVDEATYSFTVTPNGDSSKAKTFQVTVKRDSTNVQRDPSARPRAMMVDYASDPCSYQTNASTKIVYKWRFWREYVISPTGTMAMRDFPATGTSAPGDTTIPAAPSLSVDSRGFNQGWSILPNKFSGVFYTNVPIPSLQGPPRNTASTLPATCIASSRNLPECAPPAIARFMKLTVSANGSITPQSDLKYEQPICTSAPSRVAGLGQSNCPTPATAPAKNVLGLYSIGGTISMDTLNYQNIGTTSPAIRPTLHAVMMSNTNIVEINSVLPTATQRANGDTCGNSRLVTSNAGWGNVEILGSVIQSNYGQFGRQNTSGATVCGYGRSMTYDKRMLDSAAAPPAFPRAENSVAWNVQVLNNGTVGASFSLQPGFTQNKAGN